jgi:hypothetical protein
MLVLGLFSMSLILISLSVFVQNKYFYIGFGRKILKL